MSIQSTIDTLRDLRLNGFVESLYHQRSLTTYGELSFDDRLAHLVDGEVSYRNTKRLHRLLKNARLRVNADPESIDYGAARGLDRAVVADLFTCEWIHRQRNVLITGETGTGKTYLACALAVQAARQGISSVYHRVTRLLEAMEVAHADGSIQRLRSQLAKTQVLILDDFGLVGMTARGRADLLEVLDDRGGRSSVVVVGQMPVKQWHGFINDPALADATLDRLVHSSHKLTLKGESMRKMRTDG